ncbi:hypothetical protein A8H40_29235 [Burkholderia multivorans]|uniref:Uncharacterized protein n=1 Tax=Burkholderia multivorans CGD2 TaxID=513052 RepID=B9BVV4_9BURK|nr:hypothetical protein A8H40_29235 [Burkholderia multivorans]EEE05126.1 hypothetical protein BURMUCGD2_0496 [Burkholderia multivorans CGD2]EEE12489.1 hypothetical protein BURMUCGD2M_0585 [Burkholderia multivorans CGD2M]EJO56491.1 hypothetical protein BURMUCF1_2983 [Burkholderia multivorans ATCC BAA-247]
MSGVVTFAVVVFDRTPSLDAHSRYKPRAAPRSPLSPSFPLFRTPRHRAAHDFFLSGGVTRTSSSAAISGDLERTVASGPDLRRTPVPQGFAAFVTASARGRGTR